MLYSILVTVQVVIALSLVGLILLQHGKGADAGAAFGSGASGTVFGAKGSANFMSHATAGLAVLFFAMSLTLAYLVNAGGSGGGSVTSELPAQTAKPAASSKLAPRQSSKSGTSMANGGANASNTKAASPAGNSSKSSSSSETGSIEAPPSASNAGATNKGNTNSSSSTGASSVSSSSGKSGKASSGGS